MPGPLRQSAGKEVAKYESRSAKAIFKDPTTPGSLIVVVVSAAGALPVGLVGPANFTEIREKGLRDLEVAMYYRENAPASTNVEVSFHGQTNRSLTLRTIEYPGVAQSNSLDRVTVDCGESDRATTGSTGTTSQGDELVIGIIANQYDSTTQSGFGGSLAKLFETVSPASWSGGSNEDWERSRLTIHQAITSTAGSFSLTAQLSSERRWVGIMATFRGGTTGPAQMTSTNAPAVLDTDGGRGLLAVFGPLASQNAPAVLDTDGGEALMLPFEYQFRLNGLLTGASTSYDVVSHEGLYGHSVRTSDQGQPREDGELRGVDLQSARQVLFKIEVGGTESETEALVADLHRTLRPQRDEDQDMVWRHPGQAPRLWRYRPIELPRQVGIDNTKLTQVTVALRGADPRHYSASLRRLVVPVTALETGPVTVVGATNDGNAYAYPLIRIQGPTAEPPVTRVELVNISGDVVFDVALTLPPGDVLVGDMEARVTGARRSVITLNGVSKYGAWQPPREPFFLTYAPEVDGGVNVLYARTVPTGRDVVITLEWRDTFSG